MVRRLLPLLVLLALVACGDSGEDEGELGIPVGDSAWLEMEPEAFDAAWGRVVEQTETDGYFAEAAREMARLLAFWADEDAREFVDRPRLTLTRAVPVVSVGDPWRSEVAWTGGVHQRVYFLNRWGAKLTGDLWGPPDLFQSNERRPGVVITDGSLQANARMYWWGAQTLAEAGYVVLTYDVQGQGESETYGHHPDGSRWCDGVDQPADTPPFLREQTDCPGYPFQQSAVFGVGPIDAHDWFVSTPDAPHEHHRDGTGTASHNPWHALVDPQRMGAAGHSFGASGISFVQGRPELLRVPIRAIVTWDSLSSCSDYTDGECPSESVNVPRVPALNLSSDYFFPSRITEMPDPESGRRSFDAWRESGQEVVSIALAASTHLEYTSGPFHMATRLGQEISAYYTLAFFDRHLRDDPTARRRLTAREMDILHRNPLGVPDAEPTRVRVRDFTSFLTYSGMSIDDTCFLDWKYRKQRC